MKRSVLEVIVIGAGQAGLSASYILKKKGLDHLVFERGAIGESWKSQRWDSFLLNSANKINTLPGSDHSGRDPEGFSTAEAFAGQLQRYAAAFQLPVIEHAVVLSVGKKEGGDVFIVSVAKNDEVETFYSRQVIIASGEMNEKRLPATAMEIPDSVRQLHAGDYRRAELLPPGAVLVVGSAQSGIQIAEDLTDAGRQVFLATSMVARCPRRYRGKDIMDWLLEMGFFDMKKEQVEDSVMLNLRAPQLTAGQKTISLQSLARKGVKILGKLDRVDAGNLYFQPNGAAHVQFADAFSANVKNMIDGYIVKKGLDAPAPDIDEADLPDTNGHCVSGIDSLPLGQLSAVVWATGFSGNFNYIKLPVLDAAGAPVHTDGVSSVKGLYFMGMHWLRSRKSGLIHGVAGDAAAICAMIHERSSAYSSETI